MRLLVAMGFALALPAAAGAQDSAARRADALHARAQLLVEGDTADAREAIGVLREEAALRQRLGGGRALGAAWNVMGHAYKALGALDSAEAAYRRGLAVREQARDWRGVGGSLNNLGNVALDRSRYGDALAWYARAARAHLRAGSLTMVPSVRRNAGLAWRDSSAANPAVRDSVLAAWRDALRRLDALGAQGDSAMRQLVLEDLGDAHDAAGRADSARHYWTLAADVARGLGDTRKEGGLRRSAAWLQWRRGDLDSAAVAYDSAVALLARAGDPALGEALDELARVELARARPEAALRAARRALALPAPPSSAHLQAGRALLEAGEQDAALRELRVADSLAAATGDSAARTYTLDALGQFWERRGRPDSAAAALAQALAVDRARGDSASVAESLERLAGNRHRAGRSDSALVLLDEALAIRRAMADTAALAVALGRLGGTLFEQRRVDSAGVVMEHAVAVARLTRRPEIEASALLRLAGMYGGLRARQDTTRAVARQALAILRRRRDVPGQVDALQMIASSFGSVDSTARTPDLRDSVNAALDEALRLARASGSPAMLRSVLQAQGEQLQRLGDGEAALAPASEALALARAAGDRVDEAELLEWIGSAYRRHTPPRWATTAAYFDSAWAVREDMRRRAGDDAARIAFAEQQVNAARMLSWAWKERAKETGAQEDEWRAFAAVERVRGRALLELLAPGHVAAVRPLDDEARRLRAALARPGGATLAYMVGGSAITTSLVLPDGTLHVAVQEVESEALLARTALLRRALRVDSAAVRAAPAALEEGDAEGEATSRGLGLGAAGSGDASTLDARLAAMAALLFPDTLRRVLARADVADLVIVAEGALTLVPFAALPADSLGTPLGLRWRVRHAPSLDVLLAAESRAPVVGAEGALVVGDPAMPVVSTAAGSTLRLNALPGAAAESRAVARRVGASPLTGARATEAEIKRRLAAARVVHLATHGYAYASPLRARDSFVALAPGDGEDGLLTVGEVLDAPGAMAADLVVLSACQTALGTRTNVEGTVGLQRAFLARGARSLLVSQWSVDDAVTTLLMERFYAHWRGRTTAAEALRRAQADVRARHPNPRYWAAFQLVGADVRRP